ncbi:acylglycerol lipase [Geosmithia morbida]|uniref:Acylglycerol lipase n=1 Tax=Geosmithia morbida TaxID=1094350 RepID=A0A9P4YUA1_9HYPO|nr:acylglycerol lipase [Geosmithia morbida]KAF4121796.1 acylglycerol lipase [Geosmithia morbida]
MSTDSEGQFEVDGVRLYSKTWTPTGPVKAKLILVHGYSEHVNTYNDFMPLLAARGIKVFSWDQRGWGRSARGASEYGLTGNTDRVLADIAAFVQDKLKADPVKVPLFVMGHSMGGGEVCTLMGDTRYSDLVSQVRGWALECPFIGFTPDAEPSVLKVFLGRLAGRVFPRRQMKNVIPPENITRDPAAVEAIRNDPLCHNTGTLEGLASMLDRTNLLASGTVQVGSNVQSILLQHGTGDLTCSYDAAVRWVDQQTKVTDRVTKSYEGGYHQLHTDLCKAEFTADLVAWILERSEKVEAKL